jgi:hypothetical protein
MTRALMLLTPALLLIGGCEPGSSSTATANVEPDSGAPGMLVFGDGGAVDLPSTEADKPDPGERTAQSAGGPAYFGFWGDAMSGVGTGDYIADTAPFSNIHFIRAESMHALQEKLNRVKSHNDQTIIMVQHLLFPWEGTKAHADWQSRFDEAWRKLSSYHDTVLGFYLYDEPMWRLEELQKRADLNPITAESYVAFANELGQIANYIKQKTGKLTSLTEAYPAIDAGRPLVTAVDWIGFNCYRAYGNVCSAARIRDLFSWMLQNKGTQQKMMITADSYWNTAPGEAAENAVVARIELWKELVARHAGEVAAVTPFLYQNHTLEKLWGAQAMPRALQALKAWSEQLLGAKCAPQPALCDGPDLVEVDSCNNELSRISNAPDCSSPATGLISRGKSATASNSAPGQPPSQAVDGKAQTAWNANGVAAQWIRIDLGQAHSVTQVKLLIAQNPAGATTHEVSFGDPSGTFSKATTFSQQTTDGQWLSFATNAANVRYVKIATKSSPSWVAWREIEVYGSPSASGTPRCTALDPVCEGGDLVQYDSCGKETSRKTGHCATASTIVSRNKSVTASASHSDHPPSHATDGRMTTMWNSGRLSPGWIRIDLGQPHKVTSLRLLVAQNPAGASIHDVYFRTSRGEETRVKTFNQPTSEGQWLTFSTDRSNVRYVIVKTRQSPSWLAWGEIEVYGSVE